MFGVNAHIRDVCDRLAERGYAAIAPALFDRIQPGIELVLEAFDGYWRKTPAIKRLVLRSIPDESTRAAALKRGEVDVAYYLNGPIADDVRRTGNRSEEKRLVAQRIAGIQAEGRV